MTTTTKQDVPIHGSCTPGFSTVRAAFERNFRAQVNVKNVADKLYRDGTDGYFADLRNVQFSLSTKF